MRRQEGIFAVESHVWISVPHPAADRAPSATVSWSLPGNHWPTLKKDIDPKDTFHSQTQERKTPRTNMTYQYPKRWGKRPLPYLIPLENIAVNGKLRPCALELWMTIVHRGVVLNARNNVWRKIKKWPENQIWKDLKEFWCRYFLRTSKNPNKTNTREDHRETMLSAWSWSAWIYGSRSTYFRNLLIQVMFTKRQSLPALLFLTFLFFQYRNTSKNYY